MSALQLCGITAAESEFLAEDTIIKIVPSFTHPVLHFLSGDFGPFDVDVDVDVPLWLAITLRRKDKCKIVIPDWIRAEKLESFIKDEKNQEVFTPVPFHYLEIAHLLLNHARDEIPEPEKVSALLQDLENMRMDRVIVGIQGTATSVKEGEMVNSVQMTNIGALEILEVKKFFLESLGKFQALSRVESTQG